MRTDPEGDKEFHVTQDDWQELIRLLRPIHARAAGFARRLSRSAADGDDLFQEAVVRAHGKLRSLRDANSFPSWFYAILLSVHRNRARGAFWRRFLSLDGGPDGSDWDPPGEDGSSWEEDRVGRGRLARALATLPAVQREAVVLFEIEGFSIEEIGALQKSSITAVKSRLHRGRGKLRRHYGRLGFGPWSRADSNPGPRTAASVPEGDIR